MFTIYLYLFVYIYLYIPILYNKATKIVQAE